jgi:hypothetical protein
LLVLGFEPDGFGKIERGAIAMSVGAFGKPARVVRGGALVIKPDGVGEIRYRAFQILFLDPAAAEKTHVPVVSNAAAQVIVARAIGVAANCLVEVGNGVLGWPGTLRRGLRNRR